jgi:hypothetical protein
VGVAGSELLPGGYSVLTIKIDVWNITQRAAPSHPKSPLKCPGLLNDFNW